MVEHARGRLVRRRPSEVEGDFAALLAPPRCTIFAISRAAGRSSDAECDAITASRSRDVPSGTVGGRIACAKMPRSSRRSDAFTAADAEPITTGRICVSEPVSMPSSASASASSRARSAAA